MANKEAKKPTTKPPASPIKNAYLILYNAVSASLWLAVMVKTVTTIVSGGGPAAVFDTTGEFCKWTQTLAGMEVLHSLLGVVRAPFMTTLMQVFSRYAIVWGVTGPFPEVARGEDGSSVPAYAAMLVAWSTTEVIRYSYFALTLSGVFPAALHWLRYHAFFVLYPLGISSEAWLIWRAVAPAADHGLPWFSTALFLYVVVVYPPSAYILYTHMMAQRRKVMKAAKAQGQKAQ